MDLIRSQLLKMTLKLTFLKRLFHSRSQRVLFLFLTASIFNLFVCNFFPLWVLFIGPIIWGAPHLISSLRYNSLSFEENLKRKLLFFQFTIWGFVFVYRMGADIFHASPFLYEYPLLIESICLIISFLYQFHLERKINFKILISTLIFSVFISATYYYPLQTALVALIGHNYIPLFAWYHSCQNQKDLNVFYISASIYILFSIMIFFGTFMPLYALHTPSGSITFLNWDYSEVISPFVTGEFDYEFWFRIVVLYAFSQAIHYFIWMKAIPENCQIKQFPPSFQWSFNRLTSDFGSSSIILLITISILSFLMWVFVEFKTARMIYFAIASYHGFMEISSIPFLKSNWKENQHD